MTIIAWDGKSIAMDRLGETSNLAITVMKFIKVDNTILTWCGRHEQGLTLAKWWQDGKQAEDWPAFQRSDTWSILVVATPTDIGWYEQEPIMQHATDSWQAWGNGRDYALGAMAMGATAKKAVEIASQFCIYCGKGVDFFQLRD